MGSETEGYTLRIHRRRSLKKSDLLLQYNPVHKKIPVLFHGGKPISESIVILEYIEETWPQNPLLPEEAYERAESRFWTKFCEDKILTFFGFFGTVGKEQEKAIVDALEVMRILEGQGLREKKFFGGNTVGLADIAWGWMAHWLGVMEEAVGIELLEAHTFPRLHEWMENFKNVPAIKENLPDRKEMVAYLKSQREILLASHDPSSMDCTSATGYYVRERQHSVLVYREVN
ncbi:hypothetical protein HHK36_012978 [Tetracentron sinense]|uniref:Glutathione S-transferase n=1 Tax=Tetracentron sinense TaxID=13715 RepID=A0A834Z955_TETSI|nr:hypothetical protein HHK36_012978 [Tetracentron sinense]